MTEEVPRDKKSDLINQILEIELQWFLNVNAEAGAECQQHPEAFKLIRGSTFETWSEEILALYLEHLVDAQSKGKNLVREKYAKIEGLIPCVNTSEALNDIIKIQEDWQKEARDKYPRMFRGEAGTESARYFRCELDTYSPAVLESYLNDLRTALPEGKNLVIETYNKIAQKIGYSSLEEWEQARK